MQNAKLRPHYHSAENCIIYKRVAPMPRPILLPSWLKVGASIIALTSLTYCSDGSDGGNGGTQTQTVATSGVQFVYVANETSSNVSGFALNQSTGTLTPVPGSPFALEPISLPLSVAVDLNGKFAYVANTHLNHVSAFTIDPKTGALTGVSGSPFATGKTPVSVTVHPSGRFVYVGHNAASDISAFTIDSASGALTPITGSPFFSGNSPSAVIIHPNGRFGYVANSGSNNLSVFAIDSSTGTLTPISGSPFPTGPNQSDIIMDPLGRFAYLIVDSFNLVVFSIDPATGVPTKNTGSSVVFATPGLLVLEPSGRFAYFLYGGTHNFKGSMSTFSIDPKTGELSAVSTPPVDVEHVSGNMTVDPTGRFAFVGSSISYTLKTFSIDAASGALSQTDRFLGTSAMIGPASIAVTPILK